MSTPVYLRELCTNGLTSAGESRMSVNRCSSRVRTSRVVARWTHALLTLLQYMRKLVLQSTRSNLEIGACIVVVDASEPRMPMRSDCPCAPHSVSCRSQISNLKRHIAKQKNARIVEKTPTHRASRGATRDFARWMRSTCRMSPRHLGKSPEEHVFGFPNAR